MRHLRYSLQSPEIALLFKDLRRSSGDKYFKVDEEGHCQRYAIKAKLIALGIPGTAASKLLAQAHLPVVEFIRNPTPAKPSTALPDCVSLIKATVERYKDGDIVEEVDVRQQAEHQQPAPAKPPKRGPKPQLQEIEDEPDEDALKHEPRHKLYEIVQTSSGYWGIYSNDTATTRICGRERQDAQVELIALVKRKEPFSWAVSRRRQDS